MLRALKINIQKKIPTTILYILFLLIEFVVCSLNVSKSQLNLGADHEVSKINGFVHLIVS